MWSRLPERAEELWHEGFHESTGDCWDNAPTESLWGHLQVARLHDRRFATHRAAIDEVIDWLGFYNNTRLHQTLGYVSPMVFELRWNAAQQ